MGCIDRGLRATRRSANVLQEHPRITVFPLLNIIAVLASRAGLATISFVIGLFNPPEMNLGVLPKLADFSGSMEFIAYFVAIMVATAVATFFNAALVHCTRQALAGKPVSVQSGLGAAWRVIELSPFTARNIT